MQRKQRNGQDTKCCQMHIPAPSLVISLRRGECDCCACSSRAQCTHTDTPPLGFFFKFLLLLQILTNEQTNKQQNKAWEEGHSHNLASPNEAAGAPARSRSSPCLLPWPDRRTEQQPGRQTGRWTGCSESRAVCPRLLAGQGGTGRTRNLRCSAERLVPLAAGTQTPARLSRQGEPQ